MPLAIQLLGSVQVTWNDRPLKFATEHSRALLAYLAVEADVVHLRTTLATLLWPEENEANARHNLRQALFFLKRTLRVVPALDALLHVTPTTLQWHREESKIDLHAFQERWRLSQSHHHPQGEGCDTCISYLVEAVMLYQGEFLQGLLLKENPLFEEWALLIREQSHRQVMTMLNTLTLYYAAIGAYDQVQHYAAQQVSLEPWHEAGHRQLMQALAAQGQQSAALRQYESCRRLLQQELGVPPAAETTALYEQIRARQRQPSAPVRQQNTMQPPAQTIPAATVVIEPPKRLHNLPTTLPLLLGRSQELAQLRTQLCDPAQRLLTIVGMGGMGKSRLALALLEQLVGEAPLSFAHGVWFVPLIGVTANAATLPETVAGATLKAVGITTLNQHALQDTLFHYLAARHTLLLFDNFEHLLIEENVAAAATAFIHALLHAAPQVTLVVTSRLSLQLLAERVLRLEGLPVPTESATRMDQRDLLNYESIRLFVYHAQRTLPGFTLGDAHLSAVLALCRALSGMPLAIELAAALAPHFTPQELVAAIRQNLALLSSTRRDLDERHRHFSAVLQSSWQLLSPREQQVLMQCAIFTGPFSRAAVQAITGATISELAGLVDKSLIQQPGVGIYALHDLLRQFATDQLQPSKAAATAVADRHSSYYLNYVTMREEPLARGTPRQAINEIQRELDNVRQAWGWTINQINAAQADQPQLSSDCAARLDAAAYGLWQFYLIAAHYGEGVAAFHQAAEGLQAALTVPVKANAVQSGAHTTRERPWQQLLSKLRGLEALLRCMQGQYDLALSTAEEALARGIAWSSSTGEVLGLICLTQVHYFTGQFQTAKNYAERGLECVQKATVAADPAESLPSEIGYDAQILAYLYLGVIARNFDDYAQAAIQINQAVALCQTLGKLRSEMHARTNLANLARYKQDYVTARQDYEQVVQIAGELGYRRAESMARYELADVLRGLGEYTSALAQFEQALAVLQEIGEPFVENYALIDLSRLYAYMGNYPQAQQLMQQALTRSEHFTMPDAQLDAWLAASLLYHLTGAEGESLHHATCCRQAAQVSGARRYEGYALLYMGYALEGLARWDEAQAAYTAALQLYQQLDIQPVVAEAQAGLARTALAQGDTAAALAWVEKIVLILAKHHPVGLDEPFAIYLTCYQVLAANCDPRAAALLQRGAQELFCYTAQIADSDLRHAFLENVPVHRALAKAARDQRADQAVAAAVLTADS